MPPALESSGTVAGRFGLSEAARDSISNMNIKTYILILCAVGLTEVSRAQPGASVQGIVTYDDVQQLQPPSFVPPGAEAMMASLPTEMRQTKRLRFQGSIASTDSQASTTVVMSGSVFYIDYTTGRRLSQLSLNRETFLVEARTDSVQWQITGEESEFLGYPMLRATATIGTRQIEAWFTPAIPASVGPDLYHGLPGLILVLIEDSGRRTIRATSVTLGPLAEPVVPPTGGRTVSSEEFRRLQSEYTAAMDRAMRESAEEDD